MGGNPLDEEKDGGRKAKLAACLMFLFSIFPAALPSS
jgi:hypothetical protein